MLPSGLHTGLIVNEAGLSDVDHAIKSGASIMLSTRQSAVHSLRTVVLMQTQASCIMLIISMQARQGRFSSTIHAHKEQVPQQRV